MLLRLFLVALQFLTRIPVGLSMAPSREELARSARAYPLVGLAVGAILAAAYLLLQRQPAFGTFFAGAAIVVLEAAVTGGLHLDGLMDAADGLLGCWPKERALEIMRDSRVGANGVLAAVGLLLLKTGAVASLSSPAQALILLVMPCYGRWAALSLVARYPYAGGAGLGQAIVGAAGRRELVLGLLATLAVTAGVAFAASRAFTEVGPFLPRLVALLFLLLSATLAGEFVARAARRRLGGITGDVTGAAIELSELAALVAGAAMWR